MGETAITRGPPIGPELAGAQGCGSPQLLGLGASFFVLSSPPGPAKVRLGLQMYWQVW